MDELAIYCADIGSVQSRAFGWAKAGEEPDEDRWRSINALVEAVADDLMCTSVALGFECPLWVPLTEDGEGLTKARPGESGAGQKTRPWSGGGGAYALAAGLTEVAWILRGIRTRTSDHSLAFLDWNEFRRSKRSLFLWEAFVTDRGADKADKNRHWKDALAGAAELEARVASGLVDSDVGPPDQKDVPGYEVISLLGAAILRSDWSEDLSLLKQPCVVVKAKSGEVGSR